MHNNNKPIYIVHQYLEKSHFKALYDCAEENGYIIKGFIVLDKKSILRYLYNGIVKERKIFKSIINFIKCIINLIKLHFLRDKVMLVGIAPYDYLLNKYAKYFKNNNSIYFTSWQVWNGTDFPRGTISNKNTYEKLMKESFKGAACVSKLSENSIKKFFTNTSVVNHSVNIYQYKKKKQDFKVNFKKYIYLGQLIERKNIFIIVNWINNNKDLNFEFYFAGDGLLKDIILELSSKDNRVKYLGKLTKDEIKNTLRNYDYLVLPSKKEPFGIVLLESLASGVPCIVSDAEGPKEIIVDEYNGFIFNKHSEIEFDRKMKNSLFISKDKYYNLTKNAIESSKKYDSKKIIKKWIDVIEFENN